jgi:hypothetical protein
VLSRLFIVSQLEPGGSGLECGAYLWVLVASRAAGAGGELSGRSDVLGPAGRGEGLRRSHDDAAGAKPDASSVDRTTVNMGTVRGPLLFGGWVRCLLKAAGGAEPS